MIEHQRTSVSRHAVRTGFKLGRLGGFASLGNKCEGRPAGGQICHDAKNSEIGDVGQAKTLLKRKVGKCR